MEHSVLRPHPDTGVDVRDMVMAHRAFRREFRLAPAAVRRTAPGDRRHARRVAVHLRGLTQALHHHHDGEDRLLWPRLHARVPQELAPTLTVMEDQHKAIATLLDSVDSQLSGWVARPDAGSGERLASTLAELSGTLDEHLDAEEAHILPLAAAHLSVAEWQELERDGLAALPKSQAPVLVGMLMYEGDREVLAGMIGRTPPVPRFLLPRLAPRAYARRARRIHDTPTP